MAKEEKGRYWQAVLQIEILPENWEESLSGIIKQPFVYCIHTQELDKDSDCAKPHVHIIIAYKNTTTFNNIFNIIKRIGGEEAIVCLRKTYSIKFAYDSLIHNNDQSREQKRYQYSINKRICKNSFNIENYLTRADRKMEKRKQEKKEYKKSLEIMDFIREKKFSNMAQFRDSFLKEYSEDELAKEVFIKDNQFFINLVEANRYNNHKMCDRNE